MSATRTKHLTIGGASPGCGHAPSMHILQDALAACFAKGWGPPLGPLGWSRLVVPERFDPKNIY